MIYNFELYFTAMKEVLEKIASIRKSKKISQKEVANELNISQAAYAKFESGGNSGEASISIERLFKIANFLNVSVAELLENATDIANLNDDAALIKELQKKISDLEKRLSDKEFIIEYVNADQKELKELRMLVSMFEYMDYIRIQDFINDQWEALDIPQPTPPLVDASKKVKDQPVESIITIKISSLINFFRHYGKNESVSIVRKYIDVSKYAKSPLIVQESKETGKSVTRIIQELKTLQSKNK